MIRSRTRSSTVFRRTGFLDGAGLHVDVLKVQHHGSEHNLDVNFARHVSAKHYVFCGNGFSGNPAREVIDFIFASRRGSPAERTLAPAAVGEQFHFWFSTTAAAQEQGSARRRVLEELEDARERPCASRRRVSWCFITTKTHRSSWRSESRTRLPLSASAVPFERFFLAQIHPAGW